MINLIVVAVLANPTHLNEYFDVKMRIYKVK